MKDTKALRDEILNLLTEGIGFKKIKDTEDLTVLLHPLRNEESYTKDMGAVNLIVDLSRENPNRGIMTNIRIQTATWDTEDMSPSSSIKDVFDGYVGSQKDIIVLFEMTGVNDLIEAAISDPSGNKVVEISKDLFMFEMSSYEEVRAIEKEKCINGIAYAYADSMSAQVEDGTIDREEAADTILSIMKEGLHERSFETIRAIYFQVKEVAGDMIAQRAMDDTYQEFEDGEGLIEEVTDRIEKAFDADEWESFNSDDEAFEYIKNAIEYGESLLESYYQEGIGCSMSWDEANTELEKVMKELMLESIGDIENDSDAFFPYTMMNIISEIILSNDAVNRIVLDDTKQEALRPVVTRLKELIEENLPQSPEMGDIECEHCTCEHHEDSDEVDDTADSDFNLQDVLAAAREAAKNTEAFEFDEISVEALRTQIFNADDPKDAIADVKALLLGAIYDEEDPVHSMYYQLSIQDGFGEETRKEILDMMSNVEESL